MSYSDTQKLYMVAGVLALALVIGGIVMAMRKKSEKDSEEEEENYQAGRRRGPYSGKVSGWGVPRNWR